MHNTIEASVRCDGAAVRGCEGAVRGCEVRGCEGAESNRRISTTAPNAAAALRTTPTIVVPNRPSIGRSTNPVITAPAAAPIVLTAYRAPALRIPNPESRIPLESRVPDPGP